MFANSKRSEEMKFQWELRRGDIDFDSSSNDSKSSLAGDEPDHKRHRLFSSLVRVDNEETSTLQEKGNTDPANSGQPELGKPEKGKRGRSKRINSACNENKRGSRKSASQKKSTTNANENAALDDLRNHMDSLLEELKVTRKNLLSWMRKEVKKLVAEEKASMSETKEELEMHQNNNEENAKFRYQNLFGKNIQIQYQNSFEEHVQGQNKAEFEEDVQMQHRINLEENIEVQPQKKTRDKVQMQRRNSNGDQDGNRRPCKRSSKNNCTPELEHQVDCSRAIVLVASTEKDGEERLALPDKSNFKPGLSNQNVQVQQPKSIVLGIKAQNCNNGFAVKSAAKGKKPANSNNHRQIPLYVPEKDRGERPGLSLEQKFPSDSFNHVASSMYLTLPGVLTNPHIGNYRPDASPFSYIQPRIGQNEAGINPERSNPILGSSSNFGYFQPEERSRNYGQMGFRDVSFLSQNGTTTSIMGNGFTVPLQVDTSGFTNSNHFNLENLHRENINNSMNLAMNGGGAVRVPGGGYNSLEAYIANNFNSHTNNRADGRIMTFQDGFRFPK